MQNTDKMEDQLRSAKQLNEVASQSIPSMPSIEKPQLVSVVAIPVPALAPAQVEVQADTHAQENVRAAQALVVENMARPRSFSDSWTSILSEMDKSLQDCQGRRHEALQHKLNEKAILFLKQCKKDSDGRFLPFQAIKQQFRSTAEGQEILKQSQGLNGFAKPSLKIDELFNHLKGENGITRTHRARSDAIGVMAKSRPVSKFS